MALDMNGAADIADLYAWTENGSTTLTLIMTVTGTVSQDVQYAFHIGRQDTASNAALAPAAADEWTDIICTIDGDATSTSCWVGDPDNGGDYVTGDASPAAGVSSDSGNITVHIGTHADPFFFFQDGFVDAITAANLFAADDPTLNLSLDGDGYPEVLDNPTTDAALGASCDTGATNTAADVLVAMLTGAYTYDTSVTPPDCVTTGGASTNNFAGQDVDAIVIEVDTSVIGGTATNAYLQVWGSTHDGM